VSSDPRRYSINLDREGISMKKFIGFGTLLALIVAPLGMASAQVVFADCNYYPVVPSSVGTYSSFLGITNNGPADWSEDNDPPNPIDVVRSVPGLTDQTTNFDIEAGSTIFIEPSAFSCNSGGVCRVTIGAPAAVMTSSLFWTNDGAVIAITSPVLGLCPA